jgi:hypothetical protein
MTDPWLSLLIGFAATIAIGFLGLWFAGVIGAKDQRRHLPPAE